jgi:hypothetical protein
MTEVRIEPVTFEGDFVACAKVCEKAVRPDPFHAFLERYSSMTFEESTIERLTDAANTANTTDFAFKAVLDVDDGHGGIREEIVGVSHWYVGYVVVPKVDPFAKRIIDESSNTAPEDVVMGDGGDAGKAAAIPQTIDKSKTVMDEMRRVHGNLYIGKIRGKKHVCTYRCALRILELTSKTFAE